VIHSEQAIGYVLKYCTKNTDGEQVGMDRVLFEGREVGPEQQLKYYPASRIASAPECFASMCGFWKHHMKPTVLMLGIHLPDQKIILTRRGGADAREIVDLPSQLERYFGRPGSPEFDLLKYEDYYSQYTVESRRARDTSCPGLGDPVHVANMRKTDCLCMLHEVRACNQPKFAVRILLRPFSARSWDDFRTRNGQLFPDFYRAARAVGLVQDINYEARIAVQAAVDMNRPSSDLQFLFVQLVRYDADSDRLFRRLLRRLSDIDDIEADVRRKIRDLERRLEEPYCDLPLPEDTRTNIVHPISKSNTNQGL
jgi:hypothetical protein